MFELVDKRIVFVLEDTIDQAVACLEPQIAHQSPEERLETITSIADHISSFDLSHPSLKTSKSVGRLADMLRRHHTDLSTNADLLAQHESVFATLGVQIGSLSFGANT